MTNDGGGPYSNGWDTYSGTEYPGEEIKMSETPDQAQNPNGPEPFGEFDTKVNLGTDEKGAMVTYKFTFDLGPNTPISRIFELLEDGATITVTVGGKKKVLELINVSEKGPAEGGK